MRNLNSEVGEKEQQQIEWRRRQILELASQGYNQREILSEASARQISSKQRHNPSKTTSPREPAETYPRSGPRRVSEMSNRNKPVYVLKRIACPFTLQARDQTEFKTADFDTVWNLLIANLDRAFKL